MSTFDPRLVAQALDDLTEELLRWSVAASDTLSETNYIQHQHQEETDRIHHEANVLHEQARLDMTRTQEKADEVTSIHNKCLAAKKAALKTMTQAGAWLDQALAVQSHWTSELEKAQAWLTRAQARLQQAQIAFKRAEAELASARDHLQAAEARYRACMNNPERRNCGGEAMAVVASQAGVEAALKSVKAAKLEVEKAHLDVERAKARVACCRQAVGYAQKAVSLSEQSRVEAGEAVNAVERGLELAQSAARIIETATQYATDELEAAENMIFQAHRAQQSMDHAASRMTTADGLEDAAQRDAHSGRKELEHRIQLLYEVNKPIWSDTGSGLSSQAVHPDAGSYPTMSLASTGRGQVVTSLPATHKKTRQFLDRLGRVITLRQWRTGNQLLVRTFDAAQGSAPETPSFGIGRADAHLETHGIIRRIRLNIDVTPSYRRAGIARELLHEVVEYAQSLDASEIYGIIENNEARDFWLAQAKHGWTVSNHEVHYRI